MGGRDQVRPFRSLACRAHLAEGRRLHVAIHMGRSTDQDSVPCLLVHQLGQQDRGSTRPSPILDAFAAKKRRRSG